MSPTDRLLRACCTECPHPVLGHYDYGCPYDGCKCWESVITGYKKLREAVAFGVELKFSEMSAPMSALDAIRGRLRAAGGDVVY